MLRQRSKPVSAHDHLDIVRRLATPCDEGAVVHPDCGRLPPDLIELKWVTLVLER
jgi:hypothetical protein